MSGTCYRSSFFFNDTATTEIYTLSLHDALPISAQSKVFDGTTSVKKNGVEEIPSITISGFLSGDSFTATVTSADRKSTRLNSSHVRISYAVFCLKKKKQLTANKQHRIERKCVKG